MRSEFHSYISSIARYFELKVVSLQDTLQSQKEKVTKLGYKSHEVLTHRLPVTDDVVTAFIQNELRKSDCTTKGWMLVNYPYNLTQFEQFDRFNHDTLLYVFVHEDPVANQMLLEKTLIDPASGELYSSQDATRLAHAKQRGIQLDRFTSEQVSKFTAEVALYEQTKAHLMTNKSSQLCLIAATKMEETKGQEALDQIHSYIWEHYH